MSSDNLVNQLITLSKLHPYALQINGTTGKVEESGIKIEDTEILDLFPQLRGALIKQLTGLKCYAPYPDGLINEFTAQLIFGEEGAKNAKDIHINSHLTQIFPLNDKIWLNQIDFSCHVEAYYNQKRIAEEEAATAIRHCSKSDGTMISVVFQPSPENRSPCRIHLLQLFQFSWDNSFLSNFPDLR
ncbi:hypothetical protein NA56DRAFT_700843 [Hyaloscypha hepaticicola]|uniref:Uncharacterized protein n=1 Tax=Hyaloscypha hepaticicola TaxID=2082293 RepID=A0A2J6QDK8_9HELO|nr:hypothetical protein NA56DRAFT_700843 [Hyaloscypha hepaticicola]